MSASTRQAAVRSVMARAVDLLSRREHSRVQLKRKLVRHLEPGDDPGEVDRVLDQLQADQLLSDTRFAAALVRQRSQRYGALRLAHDLRARGIGADDASAALAQVVDTEAQRALASWGRRFDALPTSAAERGRQGRYLQARGFSMDIIAKVLAGKVAPSD